jgi:hypothetical protein
MPICHAHEDSDTELDNPDLSFSCISIVLCLFYSERNLEGVIWILFLSWTERSNVREDKSWRLKNVILL